MSAKTKKTVSWIAIIVVVFFLISQPEESAEYVRNGVGYLEQAAQAIITFLQSLA